MSRRNNNPSKGQFSRGLTYKEEHVPKFLQKLRQQVNGGSTGSRHTDDDDESPNVVTRRSASPPTKGGREAIPERPREGKWATGSDDENDAQAGKKRKQGDKDPGEEEDDEWAQRYGGGDDAPQIVVLNEGKHLSAEEVQKMKEADAEGAGPSFDDIASENKGLHTTVTAKRTHPATSSSSTKAVEAPKSAKQQKKDKKKEKEKKSLLSFDDV